MTIRAGQWIKQAAVTISLGTAAAQAFAAEGPQNGYKTSEACIDLVISPEDENPPQRLGVEGQPDSTAYMSYHDFIDSAAGEEGSIRAIVATNGEGDVEWLEIQISRHEFGNSIGMDAVNNAMIVFTDAGARMTSSDTVNPDDRLHAENMVSRINDNLRQCRLGLE